MKISLDTLKLIRDLMRQVVLSPAEEDFVNKTKLVVLAWEEVNSAIDEQQPHDSPEV